MIPPAKNSAAPRPGGRGSQRRIALDPDDHRKVPVGHVAERMDTLDPVGRGWADPFAVGHFPHHLQHRGVADIGVRPDRHRPDLGAQPGVGGADHGDHVVRPQMGFAEEAAQSCEVGEVMPIAPANEPSGWRSRSARSMCQPGSELALGRGADEHAVRRFGLREQRAEHRRATDVQVDWGGNQGGNAKQAP